MLGRRLDTAEPTWEARIDVESQPYLEDHRIQGSVVFPAAGYVEMATQAVRTMTGGDAVLADIELRKALFLPAGPEGSTGGTAPVQLSFRGEDAAFTIATASRGDTGERTVHAHGTVRSAQRGHHRRFLPLDVDSVRSRSTRRLSGAACYEALAGLGYHYGPAFQGIEQVWIGPGEALARIRPPEPIGDDAARHHVHPGRAGLLLPDAADTSRSSGPGR
ncbi:hypothetical protein GCM10023238_08670 [Streptomyces heliomycini]